MRLSQVLVVVAASFLVTSEAFSTTTDSNHATISKVTSADGPKQRLLRSVDEEDDEERTITRDQMKAIVKELGIDWKLVRDNRSYLQSHPQYSEYQEKMNKIINAQKKKGSPSITYHENY